MEKNYVPERLFSLSPSDNQLAMLVSFIVREIAAHTGSLRRDPVFLHLLLALSNQNQRTTFETYGKNKYPAISAIRTTVRNDLLFESSIPSISLPYSLGRAWKIAEHRITCLHNKSCLTEMNFGARGVNFCTMISSI